MSVFEVGVRLIAGGDTKTNAGFHGDSQGVGLRYSRGVNVDVAKATHARICADLVDKSGDNGVRSRIPDTQVSLARRGVQATAYFRKVPIAPGVASRVKVAEG